MEWQYVAWAGKFLSDFTSPPSPLLEERGAFGCLKKAFLPADECKE
jgi:hypothetical protein